MFLALQASKMFLTLQDEWSWWELVISALASRELLYIEDLALDWLSRNLVLARFQSDSTLRVNGIVVWIYEVLLM